MRKIFIFWIGDSKKISPLLEKLDGKFSVHLGPSKEEHDYLYKNFSFYKNSYDQKIWAFCSDVWRLYVLSKNVGLYIDASVNIGDKFPSFYDEFINNDVTLFKEGPDQVANCVMFSGKKDNVFYKSLLEFYKLDINKYYNVRVFPIAPYVMTAYIYKMSGPFCAFSDEQREIKSEKIVIESLLKIRDINRISKTGFGSWAFDKNQESNKKRANSYWMEIENIWRQNNDIDSYLKRNLSKYYSKIINLQSTQTELLIWVEGLRKAYDESNRKEDLKFLREQYRNIKYKITFKQRLIWSMLYRFFAFKKAK